MYCWIPYHLKYSTNLCVRHGLTLKCLKNHKFNGAEDANMRQCVITQNAFSPRGVGTPCELLPRLSADCRSRYLPPASSLVPRGIVDITLPTNRRKLCPFPYVIIDRTRGLAQYRNAHPLQCHLEATPTRQFARSSSS